MDAQTIIDLESRYLVQTYRRAPFVLERGEGCYLFDSQGRRYLDCMAGIAVNALGYGDPEVVAAINDQARKLIHISNLFHTTPHVELARRLVEHSFADRVFFSNSGTEAVEGAMKFARKWARTNYGNHKTDFVAFSGAFHGRTMGALAATAREHYQAPFRPLVPGVSFATFNDLASAEAAITDQTCAVLVEPVQGEGGIHPAAPEFLAGLRELCDRYHAVLIFDEIQSGLGRTGTLWAHEFYGVTPDVLCLAKPLAGGLPIGAILVTEAVASVMQPGDHGSTFAANPLVCRVAQIVFDRVNRPAFLAEVRAKGAYLMDRLATLSPPHVVEIRGRGLMVGVELDVPANRVIQAGFEHGLIMVNAGERVLRLVPPLIIERAQLDELAGKLARTLEEL
jgi:predicted acetylornithine/succinylornithine family transaminase